MDTQQHEDDERLADEVLIGAVAIKNYVISIGMPETTDPYYLKRSGWPIGNVNGDTGKLIALKPRLRRHVHKIAAGKTTAA
jgi:hypothetical protein